MNRHAAGAIAFLTSAAVLVMEIVASRLLAPYVGVTLQTYTAIIGVVLTGISVGTWLGGRLADRRAPSTLLGPVLIAGGALVFLSLLFLRAAARALDGRSGPSAAVALVVSAFLLPSTVLSMVSPLLVKATLVDLGRTGREVGRISALGTAGAIVGTFVAGFVLVATIPSPVILFVVGAVLVVLGLAAWGRLRPMSGRFPLVVLLAAGASGASMPRHHTPCDVETAYFCASVYPDPSVANARILQLDTLLHSEVDLTDDKHLIFEYTQAIGGAVDVTWPSLRAIDALHVGGGGFSMPRYVRATRPGSTNLVIERDPALIKLGRERLGLKLGGGLTAKAMDGRVAVRNAASGSYDLVIGDAFGGEAVPWHLATREFVSLVKRSLRPGAGLYALNVIDGSPTKFARAEIATVAKVFPNVAVVAPAYAFAGQGAANFIVLASSKPLDLDALKLRYQAVALDVEIRSGADLTKWVHGAKVLTDSFAPVDQLLTVE